jgi:transposase InsO family protein
MGQHLRGKLGPAGRVELVRLMREDGLSERAAAAALSVAPSTAHHWSVRERQAGAAERGCAAWALDRSSRPHRCPPDAARRRATRVRGAGADRLGSAAVGRRNRRGALDGQRDPQAPRLLARPARRPRRGGALPVAVPRRPAAHGRQVLSALRATGHAVTGDRTRTTFERHHPLGHDHFHAVVDDHSRLAYGELLGDERAPTVTAFVERALAWLAEHGITARRLMTDGAWSYTRNRGLRDLLAEREIRHIVTPPYTPRWNGKVERFHQTMEREWAKGLRYRDSNARNQALPHWIAYYNERRPHSSLGARPPISRAHNLSGQDS